MKMTWLANACFRFESDNTTILFDPFLTFLDAQNKNEMNDFKDANSIFVSHNHLDHSSSLKLISQYINCPIYGPDSIKKHLASLHVMSIYQKVTINDMRVVAYPGSHIHFDLKLVLKTLNPVRLYQYKHHFIQCLKDAITYKEKSNTYIYHLLVEDKSILFLGSLGIKDAIQYPTCDILILPYQGSSHLLEKAMAVINKLKPRVIILSHFDNAFPPISQSVDTSAFKQFMASHYPYIEVIEPEFRKEMTF